MHDPASRTTATIFVFKADSDMLLIWADRAVTTMLVNPLLASIQLDAVRQEIFAPPSSAGVRSGYRVTVPVNTDDLHSTGLTMLSLGSWIVKVRISSQTLDQDALAAALDTLTRAIMPAAPPSTPATTFAPLQDCPERLQIKNNAKALKLDMMGAMIVGASLGALHEKRAEAWGDRPRSFCRDALSKDFAVYREPDEKRSYVVAFNDGGVSASVAQADFGGLIKPRISYVITISDGARADVLPLFDKLPGPGQVAGAVGALSPITTFDLRVEGKPSQTIIVPLQ